MVAAYRESDRKLGKFVIRRIIDALDNGVPTELTELRKLRRTFPKRAGGILAFFDRPDTSNGPTEAINGRICAGGAAYITGTGFYALKRPNPHVEWFGFHELFHAFTVGGFICHYIGIMVAVLGE
jgi:hypothetical protein